MNIDRRDLSAGTQCRPPDHREGTLASVLYEESGVLPIIPGLGIGPWCTGLLSTKCPVWSGGRDLHRMKMVSVYQLSGPHVSFCFSFAPCRRSSVKSSPSKGVDVRVPRRSWVYSAVSCWVERPRHPALRIQLRGRLFNILAPTQKLTVLSLIFSLGMV